MGRYSFRPGDKVRVIRGPRRGVVCSVLGGPLPASPAPAWEHVFLEGEDVYELDLTPALGATWVMAKPSWIVPYRDGDDKAEWTEELRRICGIGSKQTERA